LETEIRKLKECLEEYKSNYQQKDNKLNEIVEKTTNILQEYELIEYEINALKEKVISKGEKITPPILNKIMSKKNPDSQITFIMRIMYEIIRNNLDVIEDNSNINSPINNSYNISTNANINKKENITWRIFEKK
jgi:DNA repair ATPase RecN